MYHLRGTMTLTAHESWRYWRKWEHRQMAQAKKALGVLGLMHGFGKDELAQTAAVLAYPDPHLPKEAIEAKLNEETGMKFTLTPGQWAAISIEINTGKAPKW